MAAPPAQISARAFAAAATFLADYFAPMAERVYVDDAAATERERGAATLARWIFGQRPQEVHVRRLQREVRLSGLRSAEQIRAAADALVEADWLRLHQRRAMSSASVDGSPIPSISGCGR